MHFLSTSPNTINIIRKHENKRERKEATKKATEQNNQANNKTSALKVTKALAPVNLQMTNLLNVRATPKLISHLPPYMVKESEAAQNELAEMNTFWSGQLNKPSNDTTHPSKDVMTKLGEYGGLAKDLATMMEIAEKQVK